MRRSPPRLALGAALPLLLATCRDDPVGPARGGAAYLAVQPVLTSPADLAAFGDAFRFRVSARDASGAPVTPFYVAWSSSDTTGLRVNATGLARAPSARAALTVRARAPSGAADSTPVTVIPVPTVLSVVSGAGQSGVVGIALPQPFRVRVTAGDGLGVKGIPVRFRALGSGGAAVADLLVVSDTGGNAQTVATL